MATEHGKGKVLIAAPVPRDLLAALDKAAQENDRSRSAEVRVALRKHLNFPGKLPKARQL